MQKLRRSARQARPAIVPAAALMLVVLARRHAGRHDGRAGLRARLPAAGQLDSGGSHTCSIEAGAVRCWGLGFSGQLGYGNKENVGDNEPPGAAGRVDLGTGRTAMAISAGEFHTCALLDNGSVRCWGFNGDGRLGLGHENDIGDDETPGSVAPVNLGTGRTATAISAGGAHTCAILNTGAVLCWGFGEDGRLGYGDEATIGDDEEPGALAPVDIGAGRTAVAISAGDEHTCALLDNQTVRCWGTRAGCSSAATGGSGTATRTSSATTRRPARVGPGVARCGRRRDQRRRRAHVRRARRRRVRCWGNGVDGRNGYANEFRIGDNETPASVGPVALGGSATAISAGNHTCARLAGGIVRCWGPGADGRLGYGNTTDIGDNETPLGPARRRRRRRRAISAGSLHTCARLADGTLRCWGAGHYGRLGFGNERRHRRQRGAGDDGPGDLPPAGLGRRRGGARGRLRHDDGDRHRQAVGRPTTASVSFGTADETAVASSDYTPPSARSPSRRATRPRRSPWGPRRHRRRADERFVVASRARRQRRWPPRGHRHDHRRRHRRGPARPPPPPPPPAVEDTLAERCACRTGAPPTCASAARPRRAGCAPSARSAPPLPQQPRCSRASCARSRDRRRRRDCVRSSAARPGA